MQSIDEQRLEADVQYRFEYLANFIGFSSEDVSRIHAFAPHLGPRIPELVDRTYDKLLGYDATARHFVPRQFGFEGETPASLADLTAQSPQIRFRKDHLNRYFMSLIGRSYDAKMVQYLDMVGKIHTPRAGNKEIAVPLIQMNVLMGLLSDVLMQAVSAAPLDDVQRMETLRAFNKLLWIQNDFVTRHYCETVEA
ncbi:MAG: protoglobin family protein [Planctomycetales bacterium]|nr:protoglobin family protein [Planctomycetales bacterium]